MDLQEENKNKLIYEQLSGKSSRKINIKQNFLKTRTSPNLNRMFHFMMEVSLLTILEGLKETSMQWSTLTGPKSYCASKLPGGCWPLSKSMNHHPENGDQMSELLKNTLGISGVVSQELILSLAQVLFKSFKSTQFYKCNQIVKV